VGGLQPARPASGSVLPREWRLRVLDEAHYTCITPHSAFFSGCRESSAGVFWLLYARCFAGLPACLLALNRRPIQGPRVFLLLLGGKGGFCPRPPGAAYWLLKLATFQQDHRVGSRTSGDGACQPHNRAFPSTLVFVPCMYFYTDGV
jgi:hypothetical protein